MVVNLKMIFQISNVVPGRKPENKKILKLCDLCVFAVNYTGCHKYVPIDQRLNFRAHRGYNLKRSTARCAKIKELELATLGTQTASIFIPLSAGLRQERLIKCPQID